MYGQGHVVIEKADGTYDVHNASPWELAIAKHNQELRPKVIEAVKGWRAAEHVNITKEQLDIICSTQSDIQYHIHESELA